ncbi:MAG: flavin reductase [Betaproteobacteria bacterium RIFCSPHIGHO2_12_FULL_69_13]|nr:MAG: flavin reductase [Betaproteobacteria bacterium RIFCSPHIGHO2_12_FULL_69_13]OGA71168.1 MAG: flavin reductase [Betaproteobacteria bacterium RIFCSPLOWO2_12_FULL_68_20]
MNILVAGAGRGIGRQLVEQALAAGHAVTALARDPSKLAAAHERLRIVQGSVLDPASVAAAMAGQNAVCCTIGVKTPWEQPSVFSEGTRRLLEAMKRSGVRRLVCITGIGAGDSRGHGGFLFDRVFFPLLLKAVYADKDRQESLVRASDTDWTIVRPGILSNGPLTGNYRALTDLSGVTARRISRADVAHFMLKELESNRYLGQTPLLTY